MDRKTSWRDRLVSGTVGLLVVGVVWLMIGVANDEAKGHSATFECLPICHHCADLSGSQHGPGLKPLAIECDQDCSDCNQARQAARRLDSVLLCTGAMDPG